MFGYVGGGYYTPTSGFFFRDVTFGMPQKEVERRLVASNEKAKEKQEIGMNAGSSNLAFPTLSSAGRIEYNQHHIDLILSDQFGTIGVMSFCFVDGSLRAIFLKNISVFNRPSGKEDFFGELLNVFSSLSHSYAYSSRIVKSKSVYERDGIYHTFRHEASAIWDSAYRMTLEEIEREGDKLYAAYGPKNNVLLSPTRKVSVPSSNNAQQGVDTIDERLRLYNRTVETLLN